jgi:DNA-directed RNA polymerase
MRKSSREYLESLSQRDLSQEYKCVNALQRTPWRTNKDIVKIIRTVWDSGEEWAGLPPRSDLPLPPYPFDQEPADLNEMEKEEFKNWRKRRNSIYQFNAKSMSKRIQVERTIQLAEDYGQYDAFWFVWQLDFRGRKYPVESFMTPQVADWGKSTIEFANGMPINSDKEAEWLAIHGANTFGEDKISLDERIKWAYANEENVVRTAEDPLGYLWWTEADKPFQFLAWVFEWYNWLVKGKGFETHLPCAADGSCNGLQHLSAILRDERGGSAVNLTPSPLPKDIYSDVADEAKRSIMVEANAGNLMAKQCLQFGIDRKLTKRSVMIVPYSGTQHACRAYIEEAIEEKVAKGTPSPWGNDYFTPSLYLSSHIWAAIGTVIVAAREVMDYVKDIGRAYAKQNLPMEWVTPTNLLVRQAYNNLELRKIKSHIDGSIIKLNYQKQIEDSVNKSKTASGASPNFIHSLDASALTKTVNTCLEKGITDFAMIHDSYGTHSPNMWRLGEVLRDEFVTMYEENDVLQQLHDHAAQRLGTSDLPDVPGKRGLDLGKVRESDYFFS